MELKSLVVMAAVAAALALAGSPSQAQPKPATFAMAPVCANCHEKAHASIDLGPHGAKNDAQRRDVPGLPRRRHRAPEGSDEGQAGRVR